MSVTSLPRSLATTTLLGAAVLVVAGLASPGQAAERDGMSAASAQPSRVGATQTSARAAATSESAAAAATTACNAVGIAPGASPAGGYLGLSLFGIAPIAGVADDSLTTFTVPAYTYAGTTYTELTLSSNGYALVGTGSGPDNSINNQNFPDPNRPNGVLAPFWTDLNPAAAGELRIGTLTDGSDTWIVADWAGVREFSSPGNLHSFEIWIGVDGDATPGEDISYAYGSNTGNGDGGFLTTGAENAPGTSGGTTYFNGTGTLPTSGTQLRVTSSVGSGLVASFQADPPSGPEPLVVSFDASASTDDGTIASYDWDFGDGATGTGVTTSHEYAAGVHTATLTVTDNAGNTCSTSQQIEVTAGFSVDDVSVNEANGTATFTVTRSGTGLVSTVDVSAVAGTAATPDDFSAAPQTLIFNTGETTEQFVVTINQDALDEADETYTVELSAPSNAFIVDGSGTGTITDDDEPPSLSVDDVNVTEGPKKTTTSMTFTVTLSEASGRTVSVTASTADGSARAPSDYKAKSVVLNFAPGQVTKTVTINVKGDKASEGNEVLFLLLSGAVNASIADPSGTGGIINDD